jgi:RNA polymerase sigma factor (sigma-70 family)
LSLVDSSHSLVVGLVGSHGPQLRYFLISRVRNRSDVPDLMQEIFLRMLRIPNGDAIRAPEAYLFTVAQHVLYQHSMRESSVAKSSESIDTLGALIQVSADPVGELVAQQSLAGLESALENLSSRERATFLYHRRDGLTLQEIADQFGVSRHMVKKYLAKALLELRRQLQAIE